MSLVSRFLPAPMTCELTSRAVDRMFTSRSEYRVSLRSDNADLRLTAMGRAVGAVSDERWAQMTSTKADMDAGIKLLEEFALPPQHWNREGFDVRLDGQRRR